MSTLLTAACVGAAGWLAMRGRVFSTPLPPDATGFDPRDLATEAAKDLRDRGLTTYSRALLRAFQKQVGLPPSGMYDGETRGALIAFGVPARLAPPQHFGTKTVAYFGADPTRGGILAADKDPMNDPGEDEEGSGSSPRA